jgi:hypothetical protein
LLAPRAAQKSDKIPSPELIERKKDNIIYYWERYKTLKKNIFTVQREIALGKRKSEEEYVAALCEKAVYLINERGLEPWDPKILPFKTVRVSECSKNLSKSP